MQQNSRRDFIKKTALAGIASTGFTAMQALADANLEKAAKKDQLNFLFQGDSITDGNRGRNKDPNHILGHGYAFSIASRTGASFPEQANQFYNRGISGNKITDLQQRWQTDTLDLKPDVLSILIGVNDTDSVVKQQNIVTVEKYEEVYRSLLDQTRTQLPGCILVLCEPFIMPVGRVKDNWTAWNEDMQKRQIVVARLAKEYKTVFVPLQKIFNAAVSRAAADYWIWDGIHPTYSGHELITREWIRQVGAALHFLRKLHF
ncbi:SGNH/GDSL hydrolase family protein [Ferruginibacter sp. SUN106]|uniref:SGNH/GDSL hydrolase family protein n=1 Tax=Ferruginibacter sp. SUN106 TaxID=2978348 RepID=UPI003D36786F